MIRVASRILFKRIVDTDEGEDVRCAGALVFESIPCAEHTLDSQGVLHFPLSEVNAHAVNGDENLVVDRRAAL